MAFSKVVKYLIIPLNFLIGVLGDYKNYVSKGNLLRVEKFDSVDVFIQLLPLTGKRNKGH